MKLRSYLIALVLVAVLPVLIFGGVMIILFFGEQEAAVEDGLLNTARALSHAVDHEVGAWMGSLKGLATSEHLEVGDLRRFHEQATRVLAAHGGWGAIVLIDLSGQQIVSTRFPFGSRLPRAGAASILNQVPETGEPAVSDLFYGPASNQWLIAVGVPVLANGRLKYVLTSSASSAFLTRLLQEQKIPPDRIGTIIDRNNLTIARTRDLDQHLGKAAAPIFAVRSGEAEEIVSHGFLREGEQVVAARHRSVLSGWTVGLAAPLSTIESPVWRSLLITAGVGFVLLLSGILFATILGRKIAAPIAALAQATGGEKQVQVARDIFPRIYEVDRTAQAIRGAADALMRSEEKFRTAVEAAPNGMMTVNREGTIVMVNAQIEKSFGYAREELIGRSVDILVPERFRSKHREGMMGYFAHPQPRQLGAGIDLFGVRKDGSELPLEIRLSPIDLPEGLMVLATVVDISERRQAAARLRLQSAALEAAANGIVITDNQGTILWVNPAFTALTGYDAAEVIGANPKILKSEVHDRSFYADLWATILSGKVWQGEIVNRRKDGTLYTEDQTITPVRNSQGEVTHFIAIKQDITERKRAEKALDSRYEEMRALQDISQIILTSSDMSMTLEKILDKALSIGSFDLGVIRLLDPATDLLEPTASRGYKNPENIESHRKKARDDASGEFSLRTMQRTGPRVEEDVPQCDGLRTWKKEGVRSAVIVPVRTENEILGVVQLGSRTPRKFSPGDIHLLEAIGNQMGIAVQKARLHAQTQQNLARIRALHEIDLAITSTLDLRTILNVLLEKTERLLPYVAASAVRLIERETGELIPIVCRNLPEEEWKAATAAAAKEGIVRLLAQGDHSPVATLNVQTHGGSLAPDFLRKHGLASSLRVPLTAKNEVLGVVTFFTSEEHEFGREEIEFLSTLAGQGAIAIQNAQLYQGSVQQADELQRRTLELETANKVKGEFLSVMSHELRTPLSVIMGYTGMLKDGMLGALNPRQQEALQKVLGRAAEQIDMVNEIMQTTQLEARTVKPDLRPTDLGGLLTGLKSEYDTTFDKQNVALLWDFPSEPIRIATDGPKVRQILQNLINNALKFTGQGTITISARVTEGRRQKAEGRSEEEQKGRRQEAEGKREENPSETPASCLLPPASGRWVELGVADTGVGIPKEKLGRIFDKFYQVDSSETRLYGGVGLGLYIVKKFTELLGGQIDVESEVGKGTTFTVTLPA